MRVKNVTIGVKSVRDVLDNAREVMEMLERGEKVSRKKPAIYFENIEVMRKAITTERLRLLTVIKEQHPTSIYELAKMLNRNHKTVSGDVRYLSDLGLIEIAKGKSDNRDKTMPIVRYEKIRLEIAV
jgi:predicted transcriptional regulator